MAIDKPNELDRAVPQTNRNKKKAKRERLARSEPHAWETDECPPDLAEQLWDQLAALDQAPQTTHFNQLKQRGVALPPPADLSDDLLHAKLWEVIHALAELDVFLCSTNHLTDRELYDRLWSDVLHEWTTESAFPDVTCHLDLVGSGSNADITAWLRYYADANDRARWQQDFPSHRLPPRVKSPFNRDRQLPQPRES
jgi:hypothetical protein